jgi:hypothetical protein
VSGGVAAGRRRAGTSGDAAGYGTARQDGAEIVALPPVMDTVRAAVAEAGSLYAWATAAGGRSFAGRMPARSVATPHGEWVVRHYRRGGDLARMLGDR